MVQFGFDHVHNPLAKNCAADGGWSDGSRSPKTKPPGVTGTITSPWAGIISLPVTVVISSMRCLSAPVSESSNCRSPRHGTILSPSSIETKHQHRISGIPKLGLFILLQTPGQGSWFGSTPLLAPKRIAKDERTHIAECEYTSLFANTTSSLSIPSRSSNSGTNGASWPSASAYSFD